MQRDKLKLIKEFVDRFKQDEVKDLPCGCVEIGDTTAVICKKHHNDLDFLEKQYEYPN